MAGREWLVICSRRTGKRICRSRNIPMEKCYGEFFTRVPTVAVRQTYLCRPGRFLRDGPPICPISPNRWYSTCLRTATRRASGVGGRVARWQIHRRTTSLRADGEARASWSVPYHWPEPCCPRKSGKTVGPGAPPVSGFTAVADWAGSAVIDFASPRSGSSRARCHRGRQ